jgi:hypothetical protein
MVHLTVQQAYSLKKIYNLKFMIIKKFLFQIYKPAFEYLKKKLVINFSVLILYLVHEHFSNYLSEVGELILFHRCLFFTQLI